MKREEFIDLSVVVACYNEMQIINKSIFELTEFLDNTKLNYELILIDDCSRDGTRQEIPKLAEKYPRIRWYLHEKNVGRGGTVTEGLKLARGKVIGFLDIDLETPQWYILPAYLKIINGSDMVVAYRVYKLKIEVLLRWIITRGYHFLVQKMLKIPPIDSEAGFKFFNREKIIPVLEEVEDKKWFWDTEIVTRAYYKKLKITELPTLFIRKACKTSTVKLFSDSLDYFKKLNKFRKEIKKLK